MLGVKPIAIGRGKFTYMEPQLTQTEIDRWVLLGEVEYQDPTDPHCGCDVDDIYVCTRSGDLGYCINVKDKVIYESLM